MSQIFTVSLLYSHLLSTFSLSYPLRSHHNHFFTSFLFFSFSFFFSFLFYVRYKTSTGQNPHLGWNNTKSITLVEGVPIFFFFKGKQIFFLIIIYIYIFFFFQVRVFLGTPWPKHGVTTGSSSDATSPTPTVPPTLKQ